MTRYGLVHNGWGVGRHCGRRTGNALDLHKRRCKKQRQSTSKTGKGKPEKHPRTNKETPEPRTEKKQPLGRRRKIHKTNLASGFPDQKTHGKSQKENSGRTGLEVDRDEEGRVGPRERVQQPQGQKEIPRPPGTAGISFCPAPEPSQNREESKKILKVLLIS